jgi:thioredoxin 1
MTILSLGPDSIDDVINNNRIVLIDMYATWCSPCLQMLKLLPHVAEMVKDYAVIGKVDVDQNQTLKHRFEITKIPTFLFFKDGKEAYRFSGVMRMAEIAAQLTLLTNDGYEKDSKEEGPAQEAGK